MDSLPREVMLVIGDLLQTPCILALAATSKRHSHLASLALRRRERTLVEIALLDDPWAMTYSLRMSSECPQRALIKVLEGAPYARDCVSHLVHSLRGYPGLSKILLEGDRTPDLSHITAYVEGYAVSLAGLFFGRIERETVRTVAATLIRSGAVTPLEVYSQSGTVDSHLRALLLEVTPPVTLDVICLAAPRLLSPELPYVSVDWANTSETAMLKLLDCLVDGWRMRPGPPNETISLIAAALRRYGSGGRKVSGRYWYTNLVQECCGRNTVSADCDHDLAKILGHISDKIPMELRGLHKVFPALAVALKTHNW